MNPPDVSLNQHGQLDGWPEFEKWATRNNPIWHRVYGEIELQRVSPKNAMKLLAYLFTMKSREQEKSALRQLQESALPPRIY